VPALRCLLLVLAMPALEAGCKRRVTQAQCDAIVERYAELVVRDALPDASASVVDEERERERAAAHGDDSFKNCTSELRASDYECAMRAPTPDALEKCLE
jgi:hypothetical protein